MLHVVGSGTWFRISTECPICYKGIIQVNDVISEAGAHYLRERQQAKIDREIAAYEAIHAELMREHPDKWVALHNQELVDHDRDRVALYHRIRTRYGRTSVLIRQVLAEPVEDIWVRTPSTGRTTA